MAVAMRGLRLKPKYGYLIGVQFQISYIILNFQIVMPSFFYEMVLF